MIAVRINFAEFQVLARSFAWRADYCKIAPPPYVVVEQIRRFPLPNLPTDKVLSRFESFGILKYWQVICNRESSFFPFLKYFDRLDDIHYYFH